MEVVASLSQGRTAAAQCGLFTHKSVPVIFEPTCSSPERGEEFKYLGTTLTNQNYIQEEIKSRLKSGNACYHSVRNILSSSLLIKNLKIWMYRTVRSPLILYGCET